MLKTNKVNFAQTWEKLAMTLQSEAHLNNTVNNSCYRGPKLRIKFLAILCF